MVTKELIKEGWILLEDVDKIIVVDIVKSLVLVQPQECRRTYGIMKLEPYYIAGIEEPAIDFL